MTLRTWTVADVLGCRSGGPVLPALCPHRHRLRRGRRRRRRSLGCHWRGSLGLRSLACGRCCRHRLVASHRQACQGSVALEGEREKHLPGPCCHFPTLPLGRLLVGHSGDFRTPRGLSVRRSRAQPRRTRHRNGRRHATGVLGGSRSRTTPSAGRCRLCGARAARRRPSAYFRRRGRYACPARGRAL